MKLNILIINQNDELCGILSRFLAVEGHSSHCISSGTEGFEALASHRPDLVIIEVSMPEISAIEIVKRLQRTAETRTIPVIVISDFTDLEIELLHIFDFIHKPVDLVRLREDLDMLSNGLKKRNPAVTVNQLTPGEHHNFHDFLITHCGLHFEKRNIKMLERGLLNRMAALRINSFGEYYHFLSSNRESRSELQKLLQFLTVGETFFFRYNAHFSAFARSLKQMITRQGEKKSLRFWSAGCSTGEEPYSMAMTVMETVPDWEKRGIRIIATDINNQAIKRAKEGVYSSWKMRVTEKKYLDKYFIRIGESYVIRDEVKALVDFSHINLQTVRVGDCTFEHEEFDAIFCRNVMIYFTTETTKKVVKSFASALKPGGALFLGHAETLSHISTEFDRHIFDSAFYYTKKTELPPEQAKSLPEHIQARSASHPRKEATVSKEGACQKKTSGLDVNRPAPDIQELYRQGTSLLESEQFESAERHFSEILKSDPDHTEALLATGLILANSGRLQDALASCDRVLAINDLIPEAYYLRGLLYEITDREEDAVHEYKKAILLKMDFVMPHYQLGKLYFRTDQQKFGIRELKNSLKTLEKCDREAIIPYSGGLSREVFLGQLREEITRVDAIPAA